MSDPAPEPTFDPSAPYPVAQAARAAIAARDWSSFRSQFATLDWGNRSVAARDLDRSNGLVEFLREVAAQHPSDVLPPTVLASVLIETGWAVRTGYRAEHVSQDQFRQFHDYLRQAEQLLVDVIARDPSMVLAWEVRMMSARGLELGLSEARRRYDQLSRYQPHHIFAQRQLLQHVCPKWSGSFEKLHAFANECAQAAPLGAINASMIAEAVIEHWAELPRGEDEAYATSASVRAELREAADRSIFHPDFRRTPGWVDAVHAFAFAFGRADDLPAAAACFQIVGPYVTEWPWNHLSGTPGEALPNERRRAYRGAGVTQ